MPDKKISELDSATTNELSDPTAVVPVAVPDDSSGVLTTKKASVSELGSTTLDGLTDVDTTGVTSGQVLKYNGAQWSPGTDDTGGGGGTSYFTLDGTTVVSNYGTVRVKTIIGNEGGEFQIEFPPTSGGGLRTGLSTAVSSAPMDTYYDENGWYGLGNGKVMFRLHNALHDGYHLLYDHTAGSDGALHVAQSNSTGWNTKHLWSDSHVGDDPPSDPVNGTMWYDTSAAAGYVYVDSLSGWIQFNASGASGSAVSKYASSWFNDTTGLINGNQYTFTHGLGTTDVTVNIYASTSPTGSGDTYKVGSGDTYYDGSGYQYGAQVTDLTTNTVVIDLGDTGIRRYNSTDISWASLYLKVVVIG